jgi:hypothetical protein
MEFPFLGACSWLRYSGYERPGSRTQSGVSRNPRHRDAGDLGLRQDGETARRQQVYGRWARRGRQVREHRGRREDKPQDDPFGSAYANVSLTFGYVEYRCSFHK